MAFTDTFSGLFKTGLDIKKKLALLLMVFGLLPAAGVYGVVWWQTDEMEEQLSHRLHEEAAALINSIERNMFERYGDVQAFGLNSAALNRANWSQPTQDNPLIHAMNGYVKGYQIYKLMMLVSPEGRVLAVNNVTAKGAPLDTARLYKQDFSGKPWLNKVLKGEFLKSNELDGTVVGDVHRNKTVSGLYGDDGFVMTFSAPVKDRAGQTVAVWVNFMDFHAVEEILGEGYEAVKAMGMESAEITLLDHTGTIIVDYDPKRIGFTGAANYRRNFNVIGKLNLAEAGVFAAREAAAGRSGSGIAFHARKKLDQAAGWVRSKGVLGYPGLGWSVLVRAPLDEAFASWNFLLLEILIALGVITVGTLAAGIFIGSRAVRPLTVLAEGMEKLTDGDTNVEIIGANRGDEIGTLWRAMQSLRDGVAENFRIKEMVNKMPINIMTLDPEDFTINYINETSVNTLRSVEHLLPCKADEVLGKCVDIFHKHPEHQRSLLSNPDNLPHKANIKLGDEVLSLEVSAVRDKDGQYVGPMVAWSVITDQVQIATRVREVVDSVASSSTEMKSTAESMASTAEETNTQASAVSAASEQATNNVQTVASAAEELSASINEIGEQVQQSTVIAGKAVDETQKTNETVQSLAEAAQKIGDVVNLINDIAAQTNLLALNATIEAARAGDAGKGFAVVASEVKSLANQTAQATEEIAGQINAMQSVTTDAVGAIGGITTTIEQINEIAGGIAAAVEEQGAATQEIARNVQEASQGTKDVSENITGVTVAAQETGKASEDLLTASAELARQGNDLQTEIEAFMQKIGAS